MPTANERRQIRAIGRGINQLTERAVIQVTLKLHSELVEHTPVDTGWARANWVPRVGSTEEEPVGTPGSAGVASAQAATQQGLASVARYRLARGLVWVTNAVPYIERLNNGYSQQEPAGFVQRAIREAIRTVVR